MPNSARVLALLSAALCVCWGRSNAASVSPTAGATTAAAAGVDQLSLGAKQSEVLQSHFNDTHGLLRADAVREKSEVEIMGNMTLDQANSIFLGMCKSADPRLVDLIENQLGHRAGQGVEQKSLRSIQRHGSSRAAVAGTPTAAELTKALNLLTDMMETSFTNYELETVRCEDFERQQRKLMRTSQLDLDAATAQAAADRGAELKAQQQITTINEQTLPSLEEQDTLQKGKCKADHDALTAQQTLVESDVATMILIFSFFQCSATPTALLGLRGGGNSSIVSSGRTSVVQCSCVDDGQPVMQIRHAGVQEALLKLKSAATRRAVQEYLRETFAQSERRDPTQIRKVLLAEAEVALTRRVAVEEANPVCDENMGTGINGSSYRGCQQVTTSGKPCQKWSDMGDIGLNTQAGNEFGLEDAYCRNPNGQKDTIWCYTSVLPQQFEYCQPVEQPSCAVTGTCKSSEATCTSMRDGFLTIASGVVDKRDELIENIANLERACSKAATKIVEATSTQTARLQATQGDLAALTQAIVESQAQQARASDAHSVLTRDYDTQVGQCTASKNALMSHIAGLKKVRAELSKSSPTPIYIADCSVSDWTDEACSAPCGGGTQERTRTIVSHPVNGTKCPPLKMERKCNIQECPVDCEVGIWTEWTECTAECGGGVQTRTRPKTQEPEFDGTPCPVQSETRSCSPQACNADCELGDWSEWGTCGRPCNTGHRQRVMPVKTEARGTGTCSGEKAEFEQCNKHTCMSMLPANRTSLQCTSKLDVIFLLDGSGSEADSGFAQSKAMVQKLLPAFDVSEQGAKIGVLVFGGPTDQAALDKCSGVNATSPPDMTTDCGMHWVSHPTNVTADVAQALTSFSWPASTSMAYMALTLARKELEVGRPDAHSVVVVVTDGMVMNPLKTLSAASRFGEAIKLIWVPVAAEMSTLENVQGWASAPWQDNVLPVNDFNDLPTPRQLNTVLASVCPNVM